MDTNDIGSVVKLGVSLASCLELHSESDRKSRKLLPKLVAVINTTASTLGKIQQLIQQNGQVYSEAGVNDIEILATTCRKIYNGILVMLLQHTRNARRDKDITSLSEEQAESLLACITDISIWSYKSRDWVAIRLKYCEHLLTQAKFELMMRYLLGCIANHQLITKNRAPGDFHTECSLVGHVGNVAPRWRGHHKHISGKMAIWNKIDSPAPSAKSSLEDIGIVDRLFGKPGNAPSTPCSIATTACDLKPVESITPIDAKTPEPTTNLKVAAEASQEEHTDNKALEKQEETLTSAFKSWIKRTLLSGTHDEWKGQDIEVWQVNMSVQSITASKRCRKLDIDDQQVRSTLASLSSRGRWKKRPQLIEQYASLDQRVRQGIDEAIDTANESTTREMVWIAMSIINEPFQRQAGKGTRVMIQPEVSISLFFRLGKEADCIYVTDAMGKKISFPYNACKTVLMLRSLVSKACWSKSINPYNLREGSYTLTTEDGIPLSPITWESVRYPGVTLKMRINIPMPPPWVRPAHRSKAAPRPPKMKPIHLEMRETLQVSYPLFPEETFKMGVGGLLGLWTNAIDCFIDSESDDSSADWSSSSTSSSFSSDSDSSRDIVD